MPQTTVNIDLRDAGFVGFANQTIKFDLMGTGTDSTSQVTVAQGSTPQEVTTGAGGVASIDLWDNGNSGTQSIFQATLIPQNRVLGKFIIPIDTASIDLWDLLQNYAPVGDSTEQQPDFLQAAKDYTDVLANNPPDNASFDTDNWLTEFGLSSSDSVQFDDLTLTGSLTLNGDAVSSIRDTVTDDPSGIATSNSVFNYAQAKMGFVDYNDASGDVSLTADTWTDVPNDTLGSFTNTTYLSPNLTTLIDDSTGYLDFTELDLGQEVSIRNDFIVTPNTNNALLQVRYVLGTGAGEYALLFWSERLDSGSGIDYQRVITFPIYMGDTNTRDNPGKLQINLSAPGTLNNNGSYISVK